MKCTIIDILECDCSANGTLRCDAESGECICKPNITGIDCTECIDTLWGSPDEGCTPCNCCPNNMTTCNKVIMMMIIIIILINNNRQQVSVLVMTLNQTELAVAVSMVTIMTVLLVVQVRI